MKKYFIIFFLGFIILCNEVGASSLNQVQLYKCVDGDTAWFIYENEKVKFRFLAIDTPESTTKIEKYGKEAAKFTCDTLKNAQKIEIEFDSNSNKKDKYERYLAWVFVDGELLQEKLISNGLAEIKYIYGDYKYLSILKKAENEAKNNNLGIWNNNDSNKDNNCLIILSIIIVIIIYIFNRKYRKKINNKVKNKIKKKIRNLN